MWYNIIIFFLVGFFLALLFLNIYFRVKVFKSYRKLIKNRVEFGASHIFNEKKMEEEVYPNYPDMKEEIQRFTRHIRYSIRVAIILIALITVFGAVLMHFRH